MKLDVRFVDVPLEDLWCEAVASLVFEEPLEAQAPIYSLNMRMGGYLASLWKSGFWKGAFGSTILVASEGRINANKILLKGLGPRSDCSLEAFLQCIEELGDTLVSLGVHDVAVWVPPFEHWEKEHADFFRDACVMLLRSYEKAYGTDTNSYIKAVFPVPHTLQSALDSIVDRLKDAFVYLDYCSIIAVAKEL